MTTRRGRAAFVARHAIGIHANTFTRLDRLGLFRRAPGGYVLAELVEDFELVQDIDRRIAAIGAGLTMAERGSVLAWLVEAVGGSDAAPSAGTAHRVRDLLGVLERGRPV